MRIATYNIFKFQGYPSETAARHLGEPESSERIGYFASVLRELDCDVIALQEGVASVRMMQRLASQLNMHLATLASPRNWPGQVLSRWPIVESRVFSHFTPDLEIIPPLSRCAGAVRLCNENGQEIVIFVLHLHPNQRAMRDLEAAIVASVISQLTKEVRDLVVLGDLNCEVDEKIHLLLAQLGFANAMATVGGGLRPTVNTTDRPERAIDHIYVSPSLVPRIVRASVVATPGFSSDVYGDDVWSHSDHLPVVIELS